MEIIRLSHKKLMIKHKVDIIGHNGKKITDILLKDKIVLKFKDNEIYNITYLRNNIKWNLSQKYKISMDSIIIVFKNVSILNTGFSLTHSIEISDEVNTGRILKKVRKKVIESIFD
jgi:hypothetical protein